MAPRTAVSPAAKARVSRLTSGCALECGVGFRQLRTCRRIRPGQLCATCRHRLHSFASVCSEETLQRGNGGGEHDEPPMGGVMTEGYGQRFGERLRVENAPAMVTRALRNADMAVTEVRCDNPPLEMTSARFSGKMLLSSLCTSAIVPIANTGRMADERWCATSGPARVVSMT